MNILHSIILEWGEIYKPRTWHEAERLAKKMWTRGQWRIPTRTEIQFAVQERILGFNTPNREFLTCHKGGDWVTVISTMDGGLRKLSKEEGAWVRLVRFAQNPKEIDAWED